MSPTSQHSVLRTKPVEDVLAQAGGPDGEDAPGPFRVPLSPVVPALSALACIYLMTNLSIETWLRFLVWMLLGFTIYFAYGRRNARLSFPLESRPDSRVER